MPPPLELDRESAGQMAGRYWNEARGAKPVEVARYYHADQLGGPSYTTDSGGRLVSFTRWHPYGTVRGARGAQPHHTFAGAEREEESELGLIQFGARWYAPKVGRWISPDPLFRENPAKGIEKPLEVGLYGYASNSPVSHVDRNGLEVQNNSGSPVIVKVETSGQGDLANEHGHQDYTTLEPGTTYHGKQDAVYTEDGTVYKTVGKEDTAGHHIVVNHDGKVESFPDQSATLWERGGQPIQGGNMSNSYLEENGWMSRDEARQRIDEAKNQQCGQ